MRYGTAHFVTRAKAVEYYASQGYGETHEDTVDIVDRKFEDGEIRLGKPKLKKGERLLVIDNGARYAIEVIE